jgi:hypothetical protein
LLAVRARAGRAGNERRACDRQGTGGPRGAAGGRRLGVGAPGPPSSGPPSRPAAGRAGGARGRTAGGAAAVIGDERGGVDSWGGCTTTSPWPRRRGGCERGAAGRRGGRRGESGRGGPDGAKAAGRRAAGRRGAVRKEGGVSGLADGKPAGLRKVDDREGRHWECCNISYFRDNIPVDNIPVAHDCGAAPDNPPDLQPSTISAAVNYLGSIHLTSRMNIASRMNKAKEVQLSEAGMQGRLTRDRGRKQGSEAGMRAETEESTWG